MTSYKEKHREYDAIRRVFYEALQIRVQQEYGIKIDAKPFSRPVIERTQEWVGRRYAWDWEGLRARFGKVHSRLELAIYAEGVLCGVLVGKPSRGRRHISAYFLEGNPDPNHPLRGKVAPILLLGLYLYGEALECEIARLVDPVPGLVARYEAYGFKIVKGERGRLYCEKALERSWP